MGLKEMARLPQGLFDVCGDTSSWIYTSLSLLVVLLQTTARLGFFACGIPNLNRTPDT